jgi:hypothetical protein
LDTYKKLSAHDIIMERVDIGMKSIATLSKSFTRDDVRHYLKDEFAKYDTPYKRANEYILKLDEQIIRAAYNDMSLMNFYANVSSFITDQYFGIIKNRTEEQLLINHIMFWVKYLNLLHRKYLKFWSKDTMKILREKLIKSLNRIKARVSLHVNDLEHSNRDTFTAYLSSSSASSHTYFIDIPINEIEAGTTYQLPKQDILPYGDLVVRRELDVIPDLDVHRHTISTHDRFYELSGKKFEAKKINKNEFIVRIDVKLIPGSRYYFPRQSVTEQIDFTVPNGEHFDITFQTKRPSPDIIELENITLHSFPIKGGLSKSIFDKYGDKDLKYFYSEYTELNGYYNIAYPGGSEFPVYIKINHDSNDHILIMKTNEPYSINQISLDKFEVLPLFISKLEKADDLANTTWYDTENSVATRQVLWE